MPHFFKPFNVLSQLVFPTLIVPTGINSVDKFKKKIISYKNKNVILQIIIMNDCNKFSQKQIIYNCLYHIILYLS